VKKLHENRYPPGLEWWMLKKIPVLLATSIFVPALMLLISRNYPFAGTANEVVRLQVGIDFFAIAIFFTGVSFLVVIGIVCFIIHVMKGPAYVADAYPLNDADEPDKDS
jgi:hypothetical protein